MMEIEGENGSTILLEGKGPKRLFGRGFGFNSDDRNVSRHHLLLELRNGDDRPDPIVCFEVLGKNPVWVRNSCSGKIRVFRSSEKGYMASGDGFCVSAKRPVWFTLKRHKREADEERGERPSENQSRFAESEGLAKGDEDFGHVSLDVSEIDPVKEFGFLVMGHEFDHYPKQMVREIKNWDWFLEEPRGRNGDDVAFEKKRKRASGKAKKVGRFSNDDDDYEDWSGQDENDKKLITKLRQVSTPNYSTRSWDGSRTLKDQRSRKASYGNKISGAARDDEDDDTLGGFIVKDEVEPEEEIGEDEEEREDDFEEEEEEEEEEEDT